jgi:hypothetical protein
MRERTRLTRPLTQAAGVVGKAGDPLPAFVNHMIRHRVDRRGRLFPLEAAEQMRCCTLPNTEIGYPKAEALKGFFAYKEKSDIKYATQKEKGNSWLCSIDLEDNS